MAPLRPHSRFNARSERHMTCSGAEITGGFTMKISIIALIVSFICVSALAETRAISLAPGDSVTVNCGDGGSDDGRDGPIKTFCACAPGYYGTYQLKLIILNLKTKQRETETIETFTDEKKCLDAQEQNGACR